MKARLIKEQKRRCGIYGNLFLPDDIIESDHIIPKVMGGLNRRENVHAVHCYCHLAKKNQNCWEFVEIENKKNLFSLSIFT